MRNIVLAAALAGLSVNSAMATELFTDVEKQKMMQLTLENFWGKAINSKGEPVQPKNEKERSTVPISKQQAYHLINKGGESGLAQWCGVDWQERYMLTLQQLRKYMTTDVQVAYAGVLHGVAQGMIVNGMKDEPCDAQTRKQVTEIIAADVKNLKLALKDQ